MTRRYVWAPLLESRLAPYSDVCVIFLRSHDEEHEEEILKAHLRRLGQRVMEVLTTDAACLALTVAAWRLDHPEVM